MACSARWTRCTSAARSRKRSLYYEHKKHDGSLPLIGVNTFLPKEHAGDITTEIELIRSTEDEKGQQIANVLAFGTARNGMAPESLKTLQNTARDRKNVFAQLMEAVKYNRSARSVTRCTTSAASIVAICDGRQVT